MMRPIDEIEFANGVGAMNSSDVYEDGHVCAAIVGYPDLRFGAQVGKLLDRFLEAAPERFRGVRQVTIEHPNDAPFRYFTYIPLVGLWRAKVSAPVCASW